jgi:hypothetical protein
MNVSAIANTGKESNSRIEVNKIDHENKLTPQ